METEKTLDYRTPPDMPATLLVIDCRCTPRVIPLSGNMSFGRVHHGALCDITVQSAIVGRRHGEFLYDEHGGAYYYIDNNSLNGTYINGIRLKKCNARGSRAYRLTDGDIIRVDRKTLNRPHPEAVIMIFCTSLRYDEAWKLFDTGRLVNITIGRGDNNVIRLTDPAASREHAILRRNPAGGWSVFDNNSQNGVSVNGRGVVRSAHVSDHDVIKIANTTIIVFGNTLIYNHPKEDMGALVVQIEKKTTDFGRKNLLRDIYFQADSGDFVLILGNSAAGTSALIRALLGESRADGKIILNGQDLYVNIKSMKAQIGLIPLSLMPDTEGTVWDTMMTLADEKLDRRHYSKEEKIRLAFDVLKKVGMLPLQNRPVAQLSEAQTKKLCVACQLVGFQKVFVSDAFDTELTAAQRKSRLEILKELSVCGKIVLAVSREPDDAADTLTGGSLFTKIAVLAEDPADAAQHLTFFGDVAEAKAHFGVKTLRDILAKNHTQTDK